LAGSCEAGGPAAGPYAPPPLLLVPGALPEDGAAARGLSSLHPPYFNLAEAASIWATATCGQDESGRPRRELYCKLVGGPAAAPAGETIQGQFCDYCNAADPKKAHPITNAIDGSERWWQSPSLSLGLKYDEVNITLDLGQFFHVAYILIKFANSPRPDLWILERSTDFGRTYTAWQYFAHSKADCWERYGKEANARIRNDDDVICSIEYSRIVPLENGEIVISLINGRPGANNFTFSSTLKEFTKATNIRLHFLRTNTLLGHLISKAQRDPTVTRRYYYSIKDISVGGQCVCHGHANHIFICYMGFQCECQHNTCGETCDRCCPGFNQKQWQPSTTSNPNLCEPCNCHGHATDCYYDPEVERRRESLNVFGNYQGGGVCINCQHNTAGINCEKCLKGYYRPYGVPVTEPHGCTLCSCNPEYSNGCEDGSGRCYCKQNYQGETCDQCVDGHHSFPFCYRKYQYIPAFFGSVANTCGPQGHCLCHRNYAGPKCSQCAPGYHHYPNCLSCQCSVYGSYHNSCDPATGQCDCRPGITGWHCDQCLSEAKSFPHCQGSSNECDPAGAGSCQCLQNVEGPTCSTCKPLYWNLAKENPDGCIECQCNEVGTLSGVRECQQVDGECYCKPNVCGGSCDTCEDGYYGLAVNNYFGCQGCKCDVGGSVSHVCNDLSGDCQCRNWESEAYVPEQKNYYFSDLHHMKFEIEDGTSPNGRGIRFSYDPQEWPGFSWRGYAQMSSIQNEVRITLNVEKPNLSLFQVILRYINPGMAVAFGHIIAYESHGKAWTHQIKDFEFPPSKEPAFITVPGKSIAGPFALHPGTWIFKIMAEGVLLDYLVLLPRDYYEAPLLRFPVTEPCTHSGHSARESCLEYKNLPLDRFYCVLGSEVTFFLRGGEYRKVVFQQPTPNHPVMSHFSGQEVALQIRLNVPKAGRYVVVLEYLNEHDQIYVGNVKINRPGQTMEARINIYSCKYSFLCRSVVIDYMSRVAVYHLSADAELHLRSSAIDFLLCKVCLIPLEDFSLEYLKPQVYCIATYTHSADSSASCIPSLYETPPAATVLDALRDGKVAENQITLRGRVPRLGRYVFITHFYQPNNPTFPVHVTVDGGQVWSGSNNASFCPHISGCRSLVMAENQIEFDITKHDISVTVKIPNGKTVVLERILVVPADSYTYTLLQKDTVDKSYDFINQCGGNSFHINPVSSSEFCRNSARSLVAAYNNGALPCNCHRNGATSLTCDPVGGQCSCKPNIIGRRCSRCQTGYYGFPSCKPCSCGRRLCDDITGKCICPPQTVKPRCEVCVRQHFGYHPLAGCERCNCSGKGIVNAGNPECNRINGQCNCKPNIIGQRCDQCAPDSYGFPNCKPCKCKRGGTEPSVCNPQTGVCHCKENVEGIQCDTCRPGSFYLDSTNPKGCTNCFCFGATTICHSTNKQRVTFVDMRNWRLEAVDNAMNVPVTFNPVSKSVVADVQELPSFVHNLYWIAPSSYLGEKLSSYGGYLSYQVKSFGLPSEGMTLLEKRPDVQLIYFYPAKFKPTPEPNFHCVLNVQGNFRHAGSNNLVSREELMMVLSRLEGLQIRGLYFTESQRLTLGEVGLEEATNTGNGEVAYNVETCSCPPEYVGDSCQECSPGFYRENNGLFTGQCVPCNCNGNTDRCLDGFGTCINCQHNTAGEKCERCKEGYFGDASQGKCRECPCPSANSFAFGCMENGGVIQCFCKEGYTGVHCESCAPGYFGNPLKRGGYCQKCNCLENGQLMNCDRLTGECISQEPKDIDPHEDCDSCNSCVITLLKDLSTMEAELHVIKFQMQDISGSAHTLGQMKHLEDLLLEQIAGTSAGGTSLPLENAAKELARAQHMIDEMRKRNFGQQLIEAEREKEEAQRLLERVRNEVQRHQAKNQRIIKTVRDSLNDYESKLRDLRESLREAKEQTKLAESLNGENEILLEDIKNNILDLLNSAEDSLSQANTFPFKLQEYEKLIAQLDGARKDLSEKVKSQSLSASKELLVVRAEEHARKLQDLARNLEEIKKNASKDALVTCAVEAATAYENIINAIKAAEAAANSANNAADSALSFKRKEGKCYKYVCTFVFLLDDIDTMITSAKNMVRNANDITSNVLDELNPIKADVENIKSSYGTTQSVDFNRALKDANNTVKNLTNILPDLFNKITSINQQLMPIANISENINRIRELIQQARDAANKVVIPMRFNGSSGVEVRLPDILDDLKGYTSLSLFLQRPLSRLDSPRRQTSNMFVMYLGNKDSSKDYIGMAVRDGHLICAYSLGGNEAEIKLPASVSESEITEATLDLVRFERIYQYANISYIRGATSSSPSSPETFQDSSANTYTLLNLDPENVVFYVGGYPPDFDPPSTLQLSHYEGCIELDSLNDRVISLYNFKRTFNLNTTEVQPCRRYKEQSNKIYFEGIGYALVKSASSEKQGLLYEQTIQTTADEGLVFFAENQDKFISLRIDKGYLVFSYKVDSQPPREVKDKTVINNEDFQQVSLSSFISNNFNISTPPFRGCMTSVKTPSGPLSSFSETLGVGRKCPEDWKPRGGLQHNRIHRNTIEHNKLPINTKIQKIKNISCSRVKLLVDDVLQSTVVAILGRKTSTPSIELGGNNFEGCISNVFIQRSHFAVDVRTLSAKGLIFSMGNKLEKRYTALYLSKGRYVLLLADDGRMLTIRSKAKYNDGQWHTVAFSRTGKKMRLVVDGLMAREGKIPPTYSASIASPVYLGGAPPLNSFVGCLRNFYMAGELVQTYLQNSGVLPCLDNTLENGVSFFNEGGHIVLGNFSMSLEYQIMFNIRPRSLNGILIHTGSKQGNYLTVYMKEGMLTASGSNGTGEFSTSVTPQRSLCDGKWHFIAGTAQSYSPCPPLSDPWNMLFTKALPDLGGAACCEVAVGESECRVLSFKVNAVSKLGPGSLNGAPDGI
uniref:Laminin subunit alpha 3 n=1 Tax=Varanus komodoensis TaxID=61221 RepID=A0A8D2JD09_VARKO